jgi:integrase
LLARTFREGTHHAPAKRRLTDDELAARAASDAQDAALILAAAYVGLRLGELRALRWRDVDFERRIVHVRRSYSLASEDVPKSGRARAVPMADQVARALDALSRRDVFTGSDELVFPNLTGGFLDDSALRRRYYSALKAAGIAHLRFHDLRKTAYPLRAPSWDEGRGTEVRAQPRPAGRPIASSFGAARPTRPVRGSEADSPPQEIGGGQRRRRRSRSQRVVLRPTSRGGRALSF